MSCPADDMQRMSDRIALLEGTVRNLIREGMALVASASLDDSAQETASLDWCCTVDEATELLGR